MHKEKIQRCFDKAVNTYDLFSYPQQMIGHQLVEKLTKFQKSAYSIVDLGCGTGSVTKILADSMNYYHFSAIDLSESFILKAIDRLKPYKIACFKQDFENMKAIFSADLVFSNMALHWSSDISSLFCNVNKILKPAGIFAFTIPVHGTFHELNTSKNDFFSHEDVLSKIGVAGFDIIESEEDSIVIGFNSWLSALRSIKATGANYLFKKEKRSLKKVLPFSGAPSLTYTTGYFIARKRANVS